MEQNINDILSQVADTTLEKSVKIAVDVNAKNWIDRWMLRKGWKQSKRYFEISPLRLGSLIRVSKLFLSIDSHILDRTNLIESNYKLMAAHSTTVARIIAAAIHNKETKVPRSLAAFILWNFTTEEMMKVITIVIRQMEVQNFMSTIISVRGLSVLSDREKEKPSTVMSPQSQGRKIASGTPSVV